MFIQKGCFTDLCSHSSFHGNIISGGDIIPYFWVSSSRMVLSPCLKWSEHVHRNRIQGNDPEYQHYMKAREKRKSTFFWGAGSWILPMLDFLVGKIRRWVGGANVTVRVSGGVFLDLFVQILLCTVCHHMVIGSVDILQQPWGNGRFGIGRL